MKGKIIALAVSFAVGFTAIFFSVRPQAPFDGKGKGKNATVKTTEEFAKIAENLPDGYEYYALAQASLDGKAKANPSEEITRENFRPVTIRDKFSSIEESSQKVRANGRYSSEILTETVHMNLTANFARDGVYYDSSYTYYVTSEKEASVTAHTNGKDKTVTQKSESNSYMEIDCKAYIGVQGAYVRYDKYNLISENANYTDGVKQEAEEEDGDAKIKNAVMNTIRKNYGKWMNVLYKPSVDLDNFDPDKSDNSDLLVQYACVEIGQMLIDNLLEVNDKNISAVTKVGEIVKMADTKSNEAFDKNGSVYSLTALGKYMLLSLFGYKLPVSGGDGVTDYNSQSAIRDSSFVLDMTDRKSPAWYLDYDYSNNNDSNDNSYSVRTSKEMHEEIVFTNIDNTVTPKIGSSKTLYSYLGKVLKDLFAEEEF